MHDTFNSQLTIDNSAAQREQSQACLNYAEPARNLDALHHNSAAAARAMISSLNHYRRRGMSVGCDEGSFSFPEELQLVALLQGILMQSIIIHDFSMKWAFSEDSHQFTE